MGLDWRHAGGWHFASRDAGAGPATSSRLPRPDGSRQRARLRAVLAAATVVAALSILAVGVGSGAQATAGSAAAQLLHTALHDALTHKSVHQVETEKTPQFSNNVSTDAGTNQGREQIAHSGGEQAQVVVVGGTAYFSGNQAALIHYFGLPAALARKVGTRWVSVPSSSSGYTVVAGGTSLPAVLGAFAIPGLLTETAPTVVDGQSVVGIKSKGPATGSTSPAVVASAIVYVTRSHTPLPLRAVYSFSKGGSATLDLSRWDEHLALKAPTNVIPVSKLH